MGASSQTHYDLLEVTPTASVAVIAGAYRAKSKSCHPDAGGDPAKFRELTEAYDTLTDPDRRAAYDLSIEADRPSPHEAPEDKSRADEKRFRACEAHVVRLHRQLGNLTEGSEDYWHTKKALQAAVSRAEAASGVAGITFVPPRGSEVVGGDAAASTAVKDDEDTVRVRFGLLAIPFTVVVSLVWWWIRRNDIALSALGRSGDDLRFPSNFFEAIARESFWFGGIYAGLFALCMFTVGIPDKIMWLVREWRPSVRWVLYGAIAGAAVAWDYLPFLLVGAPSVLAGSAIGLVVGLVITAFDRRRSP